MKRILAYIAAVAIGTLFFVSCNPTETEFNEEFLHSGSGEWISSQDFGDGTEEIHDRFASDGTGASWSATLGTPEQTFTWSLSGERLRFVHKVEMGGSVPKEYTVTTLNETKLIYRDSFGKTISCTKK